MNSYIVRHENGSEFPVDACDSDFAVSTANEHATKSGITSCRATLSLVLDNGTATQIGAFDLQGFIQPRSWAQVKESISIMRAEAKHNALTSFDYMHVVSRGAYLHAIDDKENCVFGEGETIPFPKTQTEFFQLLEDIKKESPSAKYIDASIGFDGAESVRDYNDGSYQPIIGEAERRVFLVE